MIPVTLLSNLSRQTIYNKIGNVVNVPCSSDLNGATSIKKQIKEIKIHKMKIKSCAFNIHSGLFCPFFPACSVWWIIIIIVKIKKRWVNRRETTHIEISSETCKTGLLAIITNMLSNRNITELEQNYINKISNALRLASGQLFLSLLGDSSLILKNKMTNQVEYWIKWIHWWNMIFLCQTSIDIYSILHSTTNSERLTDLSNRDLASTSFLYPSQHLLKPVHSPSITSSFRGSAEEERTGSPHKPPWRKKFISDVASSTQGIKLKILSFSILLVGTNG